MGHWGAKTTAVCVALLVWGPLWEQDPQLPWLYPNLCAGHKKPEGFCDLESPVPGIPRPGEQQPGGMMNRSLLNLSSPAALLRCANSYS